MTSRMKRPSDPLAFTTGARQTERARRATRAVRRRRSSRGGLIVPGFYATLVAMFDVLLGSYKTVSARLGLELEDGGIHGVVDGVPLQMWFGPHATHVGAIVSRPAPFELSVATKSLVGKLGELFRGHSEGIGDAEFDKTFSVKAADPKKVAALLDPDARAALLEIAKQGLHPAVDAHTIHLRRFSQGGLADSESEVERDFRQAARLAKIIGASFASSYR